ncbi:MAG TPA: ABC transporter ATP-binding protein [Chloroflexota bacterium]|jgi:NitT/TauT family transport system ATP-binding protein|nr:ABC transporter ATP-binding protein [Chloroflexota bacterium]
MAKLETRGLCKIFEKATGGTVEALRDITLSIEEGEFIAIVGASGCGKTTFLRILDGLIEPTSGEIYLDGKPVTRPGPDRGFVFQSDSLFPWRTVLDNVVFGLEVQGRPKKEARERAMEFIRLVGLAGFERNYPHELSGGMRQRANLARALTVNPELLLMDEPFAALDAQTREIMQQELLRIWNADRKTVIFITHQIDEAIFLADRVFVFTVRPGRLKEIIPIPFVRPRKLDIKRTPEFVSYVDRVWKLIEEEVRASVMAGES